MSLPLCGAGINFLVPVHVGGPPPFVPGARWPLAGVWRAGAAPSGVCGGLFWLDPGLVSLALVLWCAVVRRAAWCHVSPCCVVVVRAVLRPAGSCRVAPCCAVVCRSVRRRVVSCCGVLCLRLPCRGALHCGSLRCGVRCCLVLCRGGSVEVSPARVVARSAGRSVAGWWLGGAVRCGVAQWVSAVGASVFRSGWWVG